MAMRYDDAMKKTTDSRDYIGRQALGYMVNTDVSTANQQAIQKIQDQLLASLGPALWVPSPETLHVTLMDWLAPLVDYGEDKRLLFVRIMPEYDHVLQDILGHVNSITITFDTVRVSPGAIFAVGHDTGEFQAIRQEFLSKITLLPNTKQPPSLIHFTIARFQREIPLTEVETLVEGLSLHIVQAVTRFRLIEEAQVPMLSFRTVKEYPLKPA
jgi:hypothetical protein